MQRYVFFVSLAYSPASKLIPTWALSLKLSPTLTFMQCQPWLHQNSSLSSDSKPRLVCSVLRIRSSLLPVYINNVLMEHSHFHSFMCYLRQSTSYNRKGTPHNVKHSLWRLTKHVCWPLLYTTSQCFLRNDLLILTLECHPLLTLPNPQEDSADVVKYEIRSMWLFSSLHHFIPSPSFPVCVLE